MLRAIVSHDDGQAGHAFAPDNANFNAATAGTRHHLGEAGFHKVDLVDAFLALFEGRPQGQIDGLEMRFEQRKILAREARQNTVGCSAGVRHRSVP